jgi:hypothetical protein
MKKKFRSFPHTESVIAAILDKVSGCSKPVIKFISTPFPLWRSISGRYNTNYSFKIVQSILKLYNPDHVVVHECNECYNNTIEDTYNKDF